MAAKALRNIPKLMGEAYSTGDTIPDAVVQAMTPQTLRALINNHSIEVDGMEALDGHGASAHLKAKLDAAHDKISRLEKGMTASEKAFKTLQASHDDLAKRISALEGSKRAERRAKAKAPETQEA